jgi:hypothetical protein
MKSFITKRALLPAAGALVALCALSAPAWATVSTSQATPASLSVSHVAAAASRVTSSQTDDAGKRVEGKHKPAHHAPKKVVHKKHKPVHHAPKKVAPKPKVTVVPKPVVTVAPPVIPVVPKPVVTVTPGPVTPVVPPKTVVSHEQITVRGISVKITLTTKGADTSSMSFDIPSLFISRPEQFGNTTNRAVYTWLGTHRSFKSLDDMHRQIGVPFPSVARQLP